MHSILIGGTKGLGRVVVENLSSRGHRISVIARTAPAVALPKGATFYSADLFDLENTVKVIKQAIKDHGPLDNLVFLQRARVVDAKPEQKWQNELHVALVASKTIIETVHGDFSKKGGSIVFVSSMGGASFVDSQPLEYGIAKAGVNQMVKHYSVQLGAKQIRVNAVSCFTFLKDESKDFFLKNEKMQKAIHKVVPMQRMATAQDMAKAIGFFCSDEASFISGQTLVVDGGLSAVGQETIAFWASDVRERSL